MRKFKINVNGISYDVEVEEVGGGAYVPAPAMSAAAPTPAPASAPATATASAPAEAPAKKAVAAAEGTQIKAPMPGTILDVRVSAGDDVKKGDVLMILEAMKMENEIQAPADGKVAGVYTDKGSSVNAGRPPCRNRISSEEYHGKSIYYGYHTARRASIPGSNAHENVRDAARGWIAQRRQDTGRWRCGVARRLTPACAFCTRTHGSV